MFNELLLKGTYAFGNKKPKTFPKGTSLALIAATMLSGSSHTYSQNKFTLKKKSTSTKKPSIWVIQILFGDEFDFGIPCL